MSNNKMTWFAAFMYNALESVKIASIKIRKGRSIRKYGPQQHGVLLRVCPGRHHAWFRTPVGIIRKPFYQV